MNKYFTLLFSVFLMTAIQVKGQDFESATEAVKNMGVGWNLGNTLEAHDQKGNIDPTKSAYWGQQGLESENCWGQPTTKSAVIKMMKEAGFGAIRVPITWYNHMDMDGKVDAAWMARVKEIVGYVLDQGLYCIINVHHDTGADGGSSYHWIKAEGNNYTTNKTRYENLWRQIATAFRDYDQRLLFESYNEMLDKYSSWCFASFSAPNRYNATDAADAYKAINDYAQSFVNVVRETGGNNAQRNLVVNTYAACCGGGDWNPHLKDPLSQLVIPTDPTTNHLLVQVHDYPNIEGGINNVKKEIDDMVTAWNTHIISKGVPMILGEWGSANVDKGDGKTDYDVRRSVMLEFADYMVKKCKENNVATFYWMGLSDGGFRSIPAFNQADLAETIVKAYHGSSFEGKFPNANTMDLNYVVTYNQQWSEAQLFSGDAALTDYKGIRVELKETHPVGNLKIKCYGENGKEQYNDLTNNSLSHTVNFVASSVGSKVTRVTLQSFMTSTYIANITKAVLIKKDGTEITLNPSVSWGCTVEMVASGATGIQPAYATDNTNNRFIYNLNGQRMKNPQQGIFIQNGKKYIAK